MQKEIATHHIVAIIHAAKCGNSWNKNFVEVDKKKNKKDYPKHFILHVSF